MAQPCTAVELVLVDIATLDEGQTSAVISRAKDLSIACGCLSVDEQVASSMDQSGAAEMFDFWFGGDGDSLPLLRAINFMTVDAPRVMLISSDPAAHADANSLGIHPFEPNTPDLERMLG